MTKDKSNDTILLFPARTFRFREKGRMRWTRHFIAIKGKASFASESRSSKPMQLMVETDIDGFRSVEIVGSDLFSALGNALLVGESILMTLRLSGEVQLGESQAFDLETDTAFFGPRLQKLRKSLLK